MRPEVRLPLMNMPFGLYNRQVPWMTIQRSTALLTKFRQHPSITAFYS